MSDRDVTAAAEGPGPFPVAPSSPGGVVPAPPGATSMHPACARCLGACCESIVFPLPEDMQPDEARWLRLRGSIRNRKIRLLNPCSALADGACTIYETRPQPCRDYRVGSDACREAVVALRPGDEAHEILRLIEGGER